MKQTIIENDGNDIFVTCPHCDNCEQHNIDAQRWHLQSFEVTAVIDTDNIPDESVDYSIALCHNCNNTIKIIWDYDNIQTEPITDVIFRQFKQGYDLIAIFPHVGEINHGVLTYMHVGQHSAADYDTLLRNTKLVRDATVYEDLRNELTDIGYRLNIIARQSPQKWLKSYQAF